MESEIVRSVMNTCSCDKKEAIQLIKSEIEAARENYQADGDLYQAVEDCLSGLGLEADFEIWFAERIAL